MQVELLAWETLFATTKFNQEAPYVLTHKLNKNQGKQSIIKIFSFPFLQQACHLHPRKRRLRRKITVFQHLETSKILLWPITLLRMRHLKFLMKAKATRFSWKEVATRCQPSSVFWPTSKLLLKVRSNLPTPANQKGRSQMNQTRGKTATHPTIFWYSTPISQIQIALKLKYKKEINHTLHLAEISSSNLNMKVRRKRKEKLSPKSRVSRMRLRKS